MTVLTKKKIEGFITKNNIQEDWTFVGIDEENGYAIFADRDGVKHQLYLADFKKQKIQSIEAVKQIKAYFDRLKDRGLDDRGEYLAIRQSPFRTLEKPKDKDKQKELTVGDRKYATSLFLYADFEDKEDRKAKKNRIPLTKNGEMLTQALIHEIWTEDWEIKSLETTRKRIKKLTTVEILIAGKHPKDKRITVYYLNKKFFEKGRHSSSEKFVKVFQEKLREIMLEVKRLKKQNDGKVVRIINKGTSEERKEVRQANYDDVIGFLQAVIPYFHFETYYLVKNYNEPITKKGEPVQDAILRHQKENNRVLQHLALTYMGEIANIGSINVVKDYIQILHDAGAFMSMTTKRKIRVLVHPDLIYSKNDNGKDSHTNSIRGMFGEH